MMTAASELKPAFALAGEWVKEGIVPGVSVAVGRHGKLLGAFTAGKKSAGGGGPVDEETLYPVASVTKPFTAALVMRMVDQGALTLDEPLRRLVPGLSADKRDLNLRDLLCHTSGLASDDPDEPALWEREATFNDIVASAAALPAVTAPRQRVLYSNSGYWIADAAAAAAAGITFPEAMRREVLEPCGLREVFAAPDEALADRFARRYGKTKIMNVPYGRALASPAGGLFATARDLVRFAGIFLNGGDTPEGERVLSRSAVSLMTTSQTGALPGGIERFREWPVGSWGLGWEVKGDKSDHWTGDFTSPDTFSHPGQAGTLYWADPATGIACAILANRDLYTSWTFKPARWARLNNAIVAAVTRSS